MKNREGLIPTVLGAAVTAAATTAATTKFRSKDTTAMIAAGMQKQNLDPQDLEVR